jgi:hypothetical protein
VFGDVGQPHLVGPVCGELAGGDVGDAVLQDQLGDEAQLDVVLL